MKRFNFDEFLWFIVLILLNLSIIYLIFTGKMDFYIGKKMIKYSYITIVMMSIIIIFQFKNVFTAKGNSDIKMKLLPIILTLILGSISIYKQETFKHAELDKELKEIKTSRIEMEYLYEHELDYNLIESKNDTNSKDKNGLNKNRKKNLEDEINVVENNKKEILVVTEDNPMVLEDIRINPPKYIGRNIEIHGFVCKESYLNKNQFIIGRIIMTCCAADSKIVGIIGEYNKAYDLHENEKIIVRGTIGSSTIKDDNNSSHNVAAIIIEKLEIE